MCGPPAWEQNYKAACYFAKGVCSYDAANAFPPGKGNHPSALSGKHKAGKGPSLPDGAENRKPAVFLLHRGRPGRKRPVQAGKRPLGVGRPPQPPPRHLYRPLAQRRRLPDSRDRRLCPEDEGGLHCQRDRPLPGAERRRLGVRHPGKIPVRPEKGPSLLGAPVRVPQGDDGPA